MRPRRVNNAGRSAGGAFETHTDEDWQVMGRLPSVQYTASMAAWCYLWRCVLSLKIRLTDEDRQADLDVKLFAMVRLAMGGRVI